MTSLLESSPVLDWARWPIQRLARVGEPILPLDVVFVNDSPTTAELSKDLLQLSTFKRNVTPCVTPHRVVRFSKVVRDTPAGRRLPTPCISRATLAKLAY
jgi:hypothetical protein